MTILISHELYAIILIQLSTKQLIFVCYMSTYVMIAELKKIFFAEEVSCSKLDCHPNAECIVSRYGQPICSCSEGYQGDGKICSIIPSQIRIDGIPSPLFVTFNNTANISEVTDTDQLGPEIAHTYTVTNMGDHTVGNVRVHIYWPLYVSIIR